MGLPCSIPLFLFVGVLTCAFTFHALYTSQFFCLYSLPSTVGSSYPPPLAISDLWLSPYTVLSFELQQLGFPPFSAAGHLPRSSWRSLLGFHWPLPRSRLRGS